MPTLIPTAPVPAALSEPVTLKPPEPPPPPTLCAMIAPDWSPKVAAIPVSSESTHSAEPPVPPEPPRPTPMLPLAAPEKLRPPVTLNAPAPPPPPTDCAVKPADWSPCVVTDCALASTQLESPPPPPDPPRPTPIEPLGSAADR